MTAWRRVADRLLSIVFPPRCAGCGEFGTLLCPACLGELEPLDVSRCPRCGRPQTAVSEGGWCADCVDRILRFDSARSAFLYSGVARRVVAALKYGGERGLAHVMAQAAYPVFRELAEELDKPVVTWVPSHSSTIRERGFNQARLLARALVELADRGLETCELIVKKRKTEHQQGLSREQRRANLELSFGPSPAHGLRLGLAEASVRNIILVDDVYTTGATASEVAAVARKAWGLPVHVFTFARAMQRAGDFRD